jgi:oxygen-independent coproporphyrinogen-3 oxidase
MTSALYAAVPGNPAPVDAVLREWSLAHWSEPVSVVYVDRAASCVKRLCEKLRPGVQDAVREWTVRTGGFRVAAGDLPGLAHAGVTRLCLVLDAGDTGGLASYAGAARQAGVQSLAVDLNVDGIGTEAVEACIRSGVDHVSTYGEGEGTASGVDRAAELLEGAGYERYELWSFARPGHACRYTELCWRCGNYLGLGPGAASHLAGRRWSNTADPAAYAAALSEGRRPPREVVELTP